MTLEKTHKISTQWETLSSFKGTFFFTFLYYMVAHAMARMSEELLSPTRVGDVWAVGLECWLSGLVPFFLAASMESGFIGCSQGSLPPGHWILKII